MDGVPEAVGAAATWREFICNPARAGRFLSPFGTSMAGANAPDLDPATLMAFRHGLLKAERDLPLLAEALDLPQPEYVRFFAEDLPGLLDALANEHVTEDVVVGPGLRGNPRWDRTMLGRRTGRLMPTHYASRIPSRTFVLPENQLVRWLVRSVADGLEAVSEPMRHVLPAGLDILKTMAADAERHSWFAEVPPPDDLEPHMLVCAERQRLPGYHDAAALAERRARLAVRNDGAHWAAMLELLRARWLEPIDLDDLFELYALVLVLDILERDLGLGPPSEYGLVSAKRDHVAAFSGPPRIRVVFDQSPATVLGIPTRFADVISSHDGVGGAPRRPDILVLRDDGAPRAVMVEVKRSANERYKSDSIYKGFAYLHDFSRLWETRPGSPKLILLLPEAVRLKAGIVLDQMDLVVTGADMRDTIAKCLRAGLGLNAGIAM